MDKSSWDRRGALLTVALGAFLLVNGLLLNIILSHVASPPLNETVLDHTRGVLQAKGGDDSWGAMQIALEHFAAAPDAPLYTSVFFNGDVRFQYPPSALFALFGMHAIAPGHVRTDDEAVFEGWPAINDLMGVGFLLVTFVSLAALLEVLLRRRGIEDPPALQAARIAIVLGLTLTFYPVVKAYTLGQIQLWINTLMTMAVLCIAVRWKTAAGVLVGLVCLIKPHYALLLLWGALRGEWRFVAAGMVSAGAGLAASLAVFGLDNHLDYLRVISFLSTHGEAYYPNHSVNGLLNRLMGVFEPDLYVNLEFPAGKFPPFNAWVYGGTLLCTVAVLIPALLRRPRHKQGAQILDFSTILLSCTLASPIAWEHHYGVLLPVFAVLLVQSIGDPRRLAWLAAAYLLASNYFAGTQLLAPTVFNVAQSYLLFGAIIMLTLLHLSLQQAGSYVPGWNRDTLNLVLGFFKGRLLESFGRSRSSSPIEVAPEFSATQFVRTEGGRPKERR